MSEKFKHNLFYISCKTHSEAFVKKKNNIHTYFIEKSLFENDLSINYSTKVKVLLYLPIYLMLIYAA